MNIDKSRRFTDFFDHLENREINFLVLHHIEANSVQHAMDQLLEHGVSSHFLIDETGKIFELVAENDIAYHAGVSYWQGVNGLNKNSIGIEFINSAPFTKKFEKNQMKSGLQLCQYLIEKYKIKPRNVVGHSDIGYFTQNFELDRKQDPSHLFDWKFLAENEVGIFPETDLLAQDNVLFKFGDKSSEIFLIKEKLQKFGYYLDEINDEFDKKMIALTRVFNRHFNQENFTKNSDFWTSNAQIQLDWLVQKLILEL